MTKLVRSVRVLLSLSRAEWGWTARCLVLVPLVERSLHRRGFARTVESLARRSSVPCRAPDVAVAQLMGRTVNRVASRRWIGALCLGRSLVLWYLLRKRGIDASVVIGAEAPSDGVLPAHAWVEVSGVPVNDAADVRDRFGSFGLELPPLQSRS